MTQPVDEQSWVEKAQRGDAEAVGWLYERYFDRIYRYVYLKVGDATEAEDITEQVFLKMIEAVGNFKWQGSSFASWLYRIAHNQVVDTLRRNSRRPQVPLEPVGNSLPYNGKDPHDLAEDSIFRDHLSAAMGRLTDLQSQVITLKFGAGLTNAQVAVILDRTEGAVKALQYSALQNLHKYMSADGFEP